MRTDEDDVAGATEAGAHVRGGQNRIGTRRPWWLIVFPVLLFLPASLYLNQQRSAVYTAQAECVVGTLGVDSGALPGYISATQALGSLYSRLLITNEFSDRIASRVGRDTRTPTYGLTATPVPQASVIRISATSTSQTTAMKVAAAAADELQSYSATLGGSATQTADLLTQFTNAQNALTVTQVRLAGDERTLAAARGVAETAAAGRIVAADRAMAATQQLQANALAARYTRAAEAVTSAQRVTVVSPARSLGSDARRALELSLLVPLVVGLLVGLALYLLVVNRVLRPGDIREQVGARDAEAGGQKPGHNYARPHTVGPSSL